MLLDERSAYVIRVRGVWSSRKQYWQVGVLFCDGIDDAGILRSYDAGLMQLEALHRSALHPLRRAVADVVPLFGELK